MNQSVAILVCSLAKAEALGLDSERWIFPLSGAQSHHVVPLAEKRRLDRHPGTVIAGERALGLAGASTADIAAAELYSCFPAAIQCFARDLEIPDGRPWTVTGAMPYAGGPFNHASLEGVARMVEVLRARHSEDASARHVGLVSNLSGIFGKQACAVFADAPGNAGYGFADVTAEVARVDPPLALDGDYVGPATIAGYTVVFQRGEPAHAVAVCDTKEGRRTVVRSEDRALLEAMMREEFSAASSRSRRTAPSPPRAGRRPAPAAPGENRLRYRWACPETSARIARALRYPARRQASGVATSSIIANTFGT